MELELAEAETTRRLTRKEKRLLRQGKAPENIQQKINFHLRHIEPKTANQRRMFDAYYQNKNIMAHGIAGTGKTFLSLYLALQEVLTGNSPYKKIVIVRSVVPTRDMGFLPGNQKEKSRVYEAPYQEICTKLFGRGDAYEYLKQRGIVEFISTSFIRGITVENSIIIFDECQNGSGHELDTVITRSGENCKVIFAGDFRQSDFTKENEKTGFLDFMRILENMKYFAFIEFGISDIVRSNLVKEYIVTKDRLRINI